MREPDRVGGLVVACLGGAIVVESLRMPRYGPLFSAPGFFPLVVGSAIMLMGLALLAVGGSVAAARKATAAVKEVPDQSASGETSDGPGSPTAGVRIPGVVTAAVLSLGYVLSLNFIPYWLATAGFLFASVQHFGRVGVVRALAISTAVSAGLSLLFGRGFLIPLP